MNGQVHQRCLKKMIGQAKLTKKWRNSRPLSYVSADNMEEHLTPSHLMIRRRVSSLPDNLCHAEEDDSDEEVTQLSSTSKQDIRTKLRISSERGGERYLLELRPW